MDSKVRSKITASTQDHIEVRDIIDDLIMTKNGGITLVVQTTAVNFDLLSEYEQDNKIYAFAGLLNSLNFTIQILVKTNRIDITKYLDYLKTETNRAMSPGLKKQLIIYTTFIQNLIVTNDVLDKKFYIVIPYHPSTANIGNPIKVAKATESGPEMVKDKLVEKAKIFLYPKRDHVIKQLGRMGLQGHQLTSEELLEVIYDIYNPES